MVIEEVINIKTEINELGKKHTTEKINTGKTWFSEKFNKMDKSWTRLSKQKQGEDTNYQNRNQRECLRYSIYKLVANIKFADELKDFSPEIGDNTRMPTHITSIQY